jgi:hypothetical protein
MYICCICGTRCSYPVRIENNGDGDDLIYCPDCAEEEGIPVGGETDDD